LTPSALEGQVFTQDQNAVACRVRQAAGLGGRNFQPTSNLRCQTVLKEATDFAQHLKKCERAIADMKSAGENILNVTKVAMSAPLPHLFEQTAAGSGGEVRPVLSIGGPSFEPDTVARLAQSSSAQLESQVLVPIKRWLDVFSALNVRMKEVEALRLEVDSRRHTVIDLAASVDKLRARLSKASGADGKLEASLDETIKKLQHKEGKLACEKLWAGSARRRGPQCFRCVCLMSSFAFKWPA